MRGLDRYRTIWAVDFEFRALDGERPEPVCLVAHEIRSGRTLRLWEDELRALDRAPYNTGPDSLTVAYYASAEVGCHLALGWMAPTNVLDLFTEFRRATNGTPLVCGGVSLLGALIAHGVDAMSSVEKERMRGLVTRGGPWSADERSEIINYCESDVTALERLLERMAPSIDLDRALLRGRYMVAVARMEANGVPIDVPVLERVRSGWEAIKLGLIEEIDRDYGVFDGARFCSARWEAWLARNGVPWPRHESGALDLSDDTFREMSRAHRAISPMRELRSSLSTMRLEALAVGRDGRNRCLLSPFRARTSRNQPSNTRFVYGPSVWLRSLIRPEPGFGLSYVDWSQQEFAIAAALSGDARMIDAYMSGDPYLAFAKQAGAVPPTATKRTHGAQREQFKACALAVQYGMAEASLAQRIGCPQAQARELLRLHRATYATFWRWSDGVVDCAMLRGHLWTTLGWEIRVGGPDTNPRMLRNFPVQANGAEMLRLACCRLTELGIKVCAPVHDAVLIEAPLHELDDVVRETQAIMAQASADVLGGLRLRSDAKSVRYPDRYSDERGVRMWDTVMRLLGSA